MVGTTAQAFQYDGLSRRTFARDSVSTTNADVTFAYDSLGRVLEESQAYDGHTRDLTHTQFLSYPCDVWVTPNGSSVTYFFDALYRVNFVQNDAVGNLAAFRFMGPGRPVEQAYFSGLVVTQLNNARTHSAVQAGWAAPGWGGVSSDRLGYDGSRRMTTKRVVSWDLDGSNGYANPTAVVGFTTAYDPASDKLYERALHAEGRSALYPSYDSADRLLEYQRGTLASGGGSVATPISLPGTDKDRTYDLDGLGNWKNTAFAPVGGSATREVRRHDALNAVTRFGTTPVSYDHGDNGTSPDPLVSQRGNGNIAADGTLVLKYDALNRMSEAFLADGTTQIAAYAYDAMGRRIRKVVTNGGVSGDSALNGTTDYLYDGVQCVEERNGSDAAIRLFIWGRYVDDCVSMQTLVTLGGGALPADIYIPFSDLLYRSALLTNSSAAPVEAYDTDAYGNTLAYKAAGTSGTWFADDAVLTDNPALQYIFTGRQIDPETALYYYRARYYHPRLGRFMSRDPILYGDGMNIYGYVQSNPANLFDPFGLNPAISAPALPTLVAAAGLIAAVAAAYSTYKAALKAGDQCAAMEALAKVKLALQNAGADERDVHDWGRKAQDAIDNLASKSQPKPLPVIPIPDEGNDGGGNKPPPIDYQPRPPGPPPGPGGGVPPWIKVVSGLIAAAAALLTGSTANAPSQPSPPATAPTTAPVAGPTPPRKR